jgi:hypothetical protein
MTGSDRALRASAVPMGTTRTAWLTAHGRRPWQQVSALLSGCTCAWADLDGFHCGPPPASPPLATHVWAWDTGRLLRIRLDGSEGITAELHLTDPGSSETVQVTERQTSTWPLREGRVSAEDQWRGRTVRSYQVSGLTPLEFIRLGQEARLARPAGQDSGDPV